MKIPALLAAGDSVQWDDLPLQDALGNSVDSSAYTLSYSLRGPLAGGNVDLTATPLGTGWRTSISTAQSSALNTGVTTLTWYWQAYATKSGARISAGEGTLQVKPNLLGLSTGTVYDGSSPAEQILSKITAEISARLTGGATVEYTIGNRSLKKEPMSELLKLQSTYKLIVARERRAQSIANGQGNPGRVGVRFK